MATAPKLRFDVDIHNLLMDSSRLQVKSAAAKGLALPEPVFPRYPDKLVDPGPEIAPEKRDWSCHKSIVPSADGFSSISLEEPVAGSN